MPKYRVFFQAICQQYQNPSSWTVGQTDECMKWRPSALMPYRGRLSGYISMSNFMTFLPNDLSANAKKAENVVNKRMDGRIIIPISINKVRVSLLDTSAKCRLFLPRDLSVIPKSKLTDSWMDERIEWKQYPSVSMPNFMPFPPSDLSANVQKPENVVNGRTDGGTNVWMGGIYMSPSTWYRTKKNHFLWRCDFDRWPMTLKN